MTEESQERAPEETTFDSDDITQIKGVKQGGSFITEIVFFDINLNLLPIIHDIGKKGFPHFPFEHNSSG